MKNEKNPQKPERNEGQIDALVIQRKKTGYKAENGEEIREGDILDIQIDAPVKVFWDFTFNDGWLVAGGWLSGDGLEYYNERAVIIGSKYDNPETVV